jgi:hypothetical protein
MSGHISSVDHTMVPVHDLEASALKMQKLGFTLTPKSVHKGLGTANRCIMLNARDYVEIIAVDSDNAPKPAFANSLLNGEGAYAVALASENAESAVAVLRKNGMTVNNPFTFSRTASTTAGNVEVSFTVIMIDLTELPQGPMFICQHHSRDQLFTDDVVHHLNGATGIHSITGLVSDIDTAADSYVKLFGEAAVIRTKDYLQVDTGKTPLIFMTERFFAAEYGANTVPRSAPCFCVLSFHVENLADTYQFLKDAEIHFSEGKNGQLRIAPQEGCGDIIEFI